MASTDVVCPLSEQRTPREVLIRYLVVQCTVLTIYGHFGSLRNVREPFIQFYLLAAYHFDPVFPAVLAIRYVVLALWKFHKNKWSRKVLGIFVAGLVGKMVTVGDEYDDDSIELNLVSSWDQLDTEPQQFRADAVGFGRLAVLTLIAVQCCGTVILGVRRMQRDAATNVDRWSLLMAISGLCILMQSMISLTLTPTIRLKESHQEGQNYERRVIMDLLFHWILHVTSLIATIYIVNPGRALAFGTTVSSLFFNIIWAMVGLAGVAIGSSRTPMRYSRVYTLTLFIGFIGLAVLKCRFVYDDITEQLELSNGPWPEDLACPLLWKDSFADGILAF